MKYKLLFVILLALHAMNTMAQVTQLYQVVLIKTVKHETGLTERKFVVIDSAGVIKSEANKQGEKLAAENFTQAVNKLLNTQNFTKMPANNTLNREVKNPLPARRVP